MTDLKTYTRVCEGCGMVMNNVGQFRKWCDKCGKERRYEQTRQYWRKHLSAPVKKPPAPTKTVEERDAEFRAENQRFIESAGSYGKGRLKEYLASQNKKPAGVGAPTSHGDDGYAMPITPEDNTFSEV